MSNTIDKPGFYIDRTSGKYYRVHGVDGKLSHSEYAPGTFLGGFRNGDLPSGNYIPLTPAATNAEAREEFVQWLLSGGAKERGAALVIADKAAEIFGRVAEVNGQRSCNLERLAEEVVDECDSTVTMDSDQRRKCKQHIFLALQQAWFGEGAPEKSPDKIAEVTAKLERYKRILIDQQDFCGAASVKDCLQLLNGFEPKPLKMEADQITTLQETIKRQDAEITSLRLQNLADDSDYPAVPEPKIVVRYQCVTPEELEGMKETIKRLEGEVGEAKREKANFENGCEHLAEDVRKMGAQIRELKLHQWSGDCVKAAKELGWNPEDCPLSKWLYRKLDTTPAPEVIEGKGQRVGELAGWFWYDDSGFPTPVYKDEGDKFASEVRYIRVEPPTFPPRVPFTAPPKPEQHLIRWHRIDGTHVDMWATKHGDAWRGTEDGCTYTRVELLDGDGNVVEQKP